MAKISEREKMKRLIPAALMLSCTLTEKKNPEKNLGTMIYVQADEIECNIADVLLLPEGYTITCDVEHYIMFNKNSGLYLRWGDRAYLDYSMNDYGYVDGMVDEISIKNRNEWLSKKRQDIRIKRGEDRTYHERADKLSNYYVHRMWIYWLNER